MDDYDKQIKDYSNYDDYESNAQAHVWWSIGWPVFWFFISLYMFYRGSVMFYNLIKR
jgi:hypothetical protein